MEYVRVNSKGKTVIPKNILKPRSDDPFKHLQYLACVLISGSVCFVSRDNLLDKFIFIGFHSISILLVLIALEFARRTFLFFEEIKHLHTKYNDNLKHLIVKYILEFKARVWIASICGALYLIVIRAPSKYEECDFYALILILIGVTILSENLELKFGKLHDSLNIKGMHGLDYGSSMAHSFFHGYLKLVLPADGYTPENLKDLMLKYESDNQVMFQTHKLYILVPLSLHCPKTITSEQDTSILESKTLDSIKRNRAGVQRRSYKNSVYKILYPGYDEPIYLSAEYATPLLTFNEAICHNSEHATYYREHKKEIMWNFYKTTMDLLSEDPNCKHLCELIYFDDKDDNGEYIDVGKMLVKKIVSERKREQNRKML